MKSLIKKLKKPMPKTKRNKKPKKKQYPLDEYIDQIWYDDWLKNQEAKGQVIIDGKHYWKVGGSI
tara:strand:+ start:239 stop:433 length:195 start_codon:yes stop_codon:yes gene_type:complete